MDLRAIELISLYLFIAFIIAIIGDRVWTIGQMNFFKSDIRSRYGRLDHYKRGSRIDRENVESYFKNIKDEEDFFVDNITWHDLNMDEIFKMLANVQSSVGREVLYKMLRVPLFSKEELENREKVMEYFKNNREKRFNAQYILRSVVGKNDTAKVSNYFNRQDNKKFSKMLAIHNGLKWAAVILLAVGALTLNPALLILFFVLAIVNGFVHNSYQKDKMFKLDDYAYLISTIKCAYKLKALKIEEIDKNHKTIDEDLKNFRKLKNSILGDLAYSAGGDNGIVKTILNNIFLTDLIEFERVSDAIFDNKDSIRRIYEYVGSVDALIGVTSFREVVGVFTKPEFVDNVELSFKDLYNPLLKKPVPNSFSSSKSILLTGSNASGKSTFLRTVGLNILLAQSFNMAFAKEYKGSFFRTFSSMALTDSMLGGESYYMVEIKSLKRILNNIDKDDFPIFCIVDEILRGTNTAERVSASSEILKYMVESGNIYCMAATHDMEITYMLDGMFDNYCFEEKVKNNDIIFDYKIKEGRSKTRNAIKILNMVGYDKKIIKNAEKKAENFIFKNNWNKEA